MSPEDNLIWEARAFIYAQFAQTTRSPSVDQTAQVFDISAERAAAVYRELEDRHALFLEPETLEVRMAFPFSGVPTDFTVRVNGKEYWANCAWDMLGIPAALHGRAASVDGVCAESGEPIHLEIQDGRLSDTRAMIHFAVPFSRWYDDLPQT